MHESERNSLTRRTALRFFGTAAVGGVTLAGGAAAATADWRSVETPIDGDVNDVVYTSTGGYAVAGGGIVLERTAEGWTKVLDGGPGGDGNDLDGAGVTADGERLWFVGSSGAIGEYDVRTGSLEDHSAPDDVTNNFNDVAVTGAADDANVYVAGDSGKIYHSSDNGETFDEVTPGSGSEINGIDFYDERGGHAVDGNQTVFETADGSTYHGIGIQDADVNLYGVDSDACDEVKISGGNGTIFAYDGARWTVTDVGDMNLADIEVENGEGYSVGSGGAVFGYDGTEWTRERTPTGSNLAAVALGSTDIAVGDSGVVLEK